jgi:hypothetical protein
MPNVKVGMRERDDEMVGCGDEVITIESI